VFRAEQRDQLHAKRVCEKLHRRAFLRIDTGVIRDQSNTFPVKRREFLSFQNVQARLYARYIAFRRPAMLLRRGPVTGRGRHNRWQQDQDCAKLAKHQS
jgi:hypothetical protein